MKCEGNCLEAENGENVYSYSMDMEKPYDWHCNVDIYSLYGHRKVIESGIYIR
jgi:hypothetical protein